MKIATAITKLNYYQNQDEAGVYAAVTFQFGGEDRVDCRRLYEFELRERERV